jgi:hypothetical protein
VYAQKKVGAAGEQQEKQSETPMGQRHKDV